MDEHEDHQLDRQIAGRTFPVFHSWQSDDKKARNVIERELDKALKAVGRETGVRFEKWKAARRAGAMDIAAGILEDIERAECLVADISFINRQGGSKRKHRRLVPNPNVAVEVGWGAKALGWNRIVLVHNLDSGSVELAPFDLRGRTIVPFSLADEVSGQRALASRLQVALRGVLQADSEPRGAEWIGNSEWRYRRARAAMDLVNVAFVLDLYIDGFERHPLFLPCYAIPTAGIHAFLEPAWLELDFHDAVTLHQFASDADVVNLLASRIPIGSTQGIEFTVQSLQASIDKLSEWLPAVREILEHANRVGRPRLGERMPRCPVERPVPLPDNEA